MSGSVTDIRICKLPYQDHPFVHGVQDGRDVWLMSNGLWTDVDGHPDASIPFKESDVDGHPDASIPLRGGLACVSDIVEDNGRTVRENNMALGHSIPVGTLVEVKYDEWHGDGACSKVHARLWVIWHTRDCDGTPLYTLGESRDPARYDYTSHGLGGLAERDLTTVEVDAGLREGQGALQWDD